MVYGFYGLGPKFETTVAKKWNFLSCLVLNFRILTKGWPGK